MSTRRRDLPSISRMAPTRAKRYSPLALPITRTRATDDRLLLTSPRALQVVDASDRDAPEVTATVELYVNVRDIIEINGRAVQLVYRDNDEPMELCTVLPNQRVALKKQTEEQMQKMIKVASGYGIHFL